MDVTQRRYLEGFFHGLRAREAGAAFGGGHNGCHPGVTPTAADPWGVLLACATEDRPPRAGERAGLRALGVVDLGPEGWDGCRLRLRATPGGRLRAWQLRELAAVSQECAGGFIKLGPGGGPELAVVGWREAAGALARLRAVGLAGGEDVLWCSPAAGLDAEEVFDVTPLAMMLDAGLKTGDGGPRVRLDGGARGWTGAAAAEGLDLRAVGGPDGGVVFLVTAGAATLRVPAGQAACAAMLLAGKFRQNGGGWDGLDVGELREELGGNLSDAPEAPARTDPGLPPGTTFAQKQPGLYALVAAGPGDGRWRSRALLALAELTEAEGAAEARLWLGGVLVPGVAEARVGDGAGRLAEIVTLVR